MPLEQMEQPALPVPSAYLPDAQAVQLVAPGAEKVPQPQFPQELAPADELKVPAKHLVHEVDPAVDE